MTASSAWTPEDALVREVRDQFDRAIASYRANRNLVTEHANHEESIRVGGYADRTLLELVQNAADAMAVDEHAPELGSGRVEIVLDEDAGVLYCANEGRPFAHSGLVGITHAHLSAKRGDEIGRFGLGFKSVLAVSSHPMVLSRSVSFCFNSRDARAAISEIAPSVRRLPVLRTATVVDPTAEFEIDPTLAQLADWATTIVKLPGVTACDRLRREIENFASEFLLFVPAVREIRLRVIGDRAFETSHVSRDLRGGLFKIERPDGDGDEWIVTSRMHSPSPEARREVGEAVSRAQVRVSIAVPLKQSKQRIGRFWSYFALQDQTSASALFNAPWSVNDDRTTLLKNTYNREILGVISDMFVKALPRVSTAEDPAAHLDYMPARGREPLSFGDEVLCTRVPVIAAGDQLVPDSTGALTGPADLKPLDFGMNRVEAGIHHAWSESPHTGRDVPHWRCYSSGQRFTRLRQIFLAATLGMVADDGGKDVRHALERMPKRGLLSWLREWAEGPDTESSANALRFVVGHRDLGEVEKAKVIPTTQGMRTLGDRHSVFLHRVDDIEADGAVFVLPAFLAEPGMEELLKRAGFRDLDPQAILNARVSRLSGQSVSEDFIAVWQAVRAVSVHDAVKILSRHSVTLKVPTKDGGWAWPRQVLDLDVSLGESYARQELDRGRCLADVAHQLGVVRRPVKSFPLEDEPLLSEYRDWVVDSLNGDRGFAERSIKDVEFHQADGPGPFSVLMLLQAAGASDVVREQWTLGVLESAVSHWTCEDVDTNAAYRVPSPVLWAVGRAGVLGSDLGRRPATDVVAPSMLKFSKLLPLYRGPRNVAELLDLPDELDAVAPHVLQYALGADLFPPSLDDSVLVEFVIAAARRGYPDSRPPSVPARVRRAIEGRAPGSVYVAETDEQATFLFDRQRPYLKTADSDAAAALIGVIGCRRFEDSFVFTMLVEGEDERERVLDVFTGLRNWPGTEAVENATIARALQIVKRVTTEDGSEDKVERHHLDGINLVVHADASERELLEAVSEAFGLGLNNADVTQVLRKGLDHQLELLQVEARAAGSDEARLDVYFGPDDLREQLPSGLWAALESQRLVDRDTSIAELFLLVHGSDSIRHLASLFRDLGFTDVPNEWAGRQTTVSWLREMGFSARYAGKRRTPQEHEFVVPGAVKLNDLHVFQQKISRRIRDVLTLREPNGRHLKAMVELPTGAGKTRVATETVLRLFAEGGLVGPVLWIAESQELCEQAVQTWSLVWRSLNDERPLTIGRLWENHAVSEPETEFSVIVATDAKLDVLLGHLEYEWLSHATAVFVDEGHRAGDSPRYTRILNWLGIAGHGYERPLVGLSATPFKGTSESRTTALVSRFGGRKIDAFDDDNAYRRLAELGVLARVKHEVLPGVRLTLRADEQADARDKRRVSPSVLERLAADNHRMGILVDHIMTQDPSWSILVFTPNVLSAQVLAATLRYRGVDAASVSGQTGRQERRDTIDRFKDGRIRVLANCDLLIQGFDAPGVRALYIARPTFSPNAYIQMAGRGLRGPENGGKPECLIVDMADNFGDVTELLGYREFEALWQEQQA